MTNLLSPTHASQTPWLSDDGHGGYENPVLYADYSDPDVIRVGDDFWLTASSFNCTPGLPILHSSDLVNWSIVGHALKNLPHPRYAEVQQGCGVWAPAIRYHAQRFWIFFPTPDEGIYMTTAADPRGPWTEPHLVQEGKGLIDPCPLWNADGCAYLIFAYAGSRAGIKHRLDIREMSPDGTHLIGPARTIFNDPANHPTAEGPKFYRRDGWYYVFAPAGGVAMGWQMVLRSRHVFGPYEHRVVLAQGSTHVNGPHQGALVDTGNGEDWFLHFQELQPYGRIVHLQPVGWREGWPEIGEPSSRPGVGQPVQRHLKPIAASVPRRGPATSDDFNTPTLGNQWQWHANHHEGWQSLSARPGWLRLKSMPTHPKELCLTPHLLLQKFSAPAFRAETKVQIATPGTSGGMAIVGRESAALLLERTGDVCRIVLEIQGTSVYRQTLTGDSVELRTDVHPGGACRFAFGVNDTWVNLPIPFQAVEGMWIGAKVGLFARGSGDGGSADFKYYRVEKLPADSNVDGVETPRPTSKNRKPSEDRPKIVLRLF